MTKLLFGCRVRSARGAAPVGKLDKTADGFREKKDVFKMNYLIVMI